MTAAIRLPPGVTRRLAEKSIELNLPRQLGAAMPGAFWFGLTQDQEARNGYDAAVESRGTLFLFQYKVSTYRLASGCRRFQLPHEQMVTLKAQVNLSRRVFYVLPDVGTIDELAAQSWDLLRCTWLIDVVDLPTPVPAPTKRDGSPRVSEIHYLDLHANGWPAYGVMRSEPTPVPVLPAGQVVGEDIPVTARIARDQPSPDPMLGHFWAIREAISKHGMAFVVPGASAGIR